VHSRARHEYQRARDAALDEIHQGVTVGRDDPEVVTALMKLLA
jgi:hypothetical protein